MSSHYEKHKETIKRCAREWTKRQPPEYRENYLRPIIRKSVAKHYQKNKEKILAYKREYYQKKKAAKLLELEKPEILEKTEILQN